MVTKPSSSVEGAFRETTRSRPGSPTPPRRTNRSGVFPFARAGAIPGAFGVLGACAFLGLFAISGWCVSSAVAADVSSPGSLAATEAPSTAAVSSSVVEGSPRLSILRVAHDIHFPPYEFLDEEGRSQGFAVELIREAARRLGFDVEFEPLPRQGVLEALRRGVVDLVPSMLHSPDSSQEWTLGSPWGETWSVIFVLQESRFQRLGDLWGRRIAVPSGDIEEETLARSRGFNPVPTANTKEALWLLDRDEVHAVACNRAVALHELRHSVIPLGRVRVLDDPLVVTPVGIAGRPEKQYAIQALSESVEDMKKDGTFEALHWKWFMRPSDESIRARQQEDLLRRFVYGLFAALALLLGIGFVYYKRQKSSLEKLVRKRTRELTLSERHYRALFDHARDAIFLLDPKTLKIRDINPSAAELTGRPKRKLFGRGIEDLFPSDERPKARGFLESHRSDDDSPRMEELTVWRPDGTRVVAQVRGALVELEERTVLYAVFRDVTETALARRRLVEMNEELRIQNALALALQHDLPLGQRLGAGLEALLGLDKFRIQKRGFIFLREPGSEDLFLATARGIEGIVTLEQVEAAPETTALRPYRTSSAAPGCLRRTLEGETQQLDECHERVFPSTVVEDEGEHGHYLIPLRSEGRILGILGLHVEPGAKSVASRLRFLEGLCGQIGLVIESELHKQALREREHRLESLYEIAISLGSSLHLTEQLRVLFVQIRRVMSADAGNVWVSDTEPFSGKAEVYYSYDTDEKGTLIESTERNEGEAALGTTIHRVFTGSGPVLLLRSEEDMQQLDNDGASLFGLERRSHSLLYVPLKFKGRVIGVLTVQSYLPRAYTQETVDVLMALSAPLAAVIENARLFEAVEQRRAELDRSLKLIESDLQAAQVAQESLLPREYPNMPGWEFASIFIPSQYVGGDIYNVFELDERHFGLYHIDVSGHGVPAALFSVGLNHYLMRDLTGPGVMRAASDQPGRFRIRSPEEVVTALDRENMFQKYQRFLTMLYLVADTETGTVRFYRAGHNEPLLLRNGQPPRYLSGGGPLIGFQLPHHRNELQEIRLQPGDRLVVYSDGINEALRQDGEMFGLERMADFLAQANGQRLQTALDDLVEEVRRFSDSHGFEDDVSMIGFSWNPPAK